MFVVLFVQILNLALNDRIFGILQQVVGVFNSIEISGAALASAGTALRVWFVFEIRGIYSII